MTIALRISLSFSPGFNRVMSAIRFLLTVSTVCFFAAEQETVETVAKTKGGLNYPVETG
jgi:hypothetical protein